MGRRWEFKREFFSIDSASHSAVRVGLDLLYRAGLAAGHVKLDEPATGEKRGCGG